MVKDKRKKDAPTATETPLNPNISNAIRIDVIGQFVTPQNTAAIPHAAHIDGESPSQFPIIHPKVAPIQNEGTISPPRNPARIVNAVRTNFQKKSRGLACPSSTAFSISSAPAPI